MEKIPDPAHPNREVYNELQRVMGSNRFIFTEGGIFFLIIIVLGALPALLYGAAGIILIGLAFTFEKPYQLLRALLPYGNWPEHLVTLPARRKIYNVVFLILFILWSVTIFWLLFRFVWPLIIPGSTNPWCDGSLICTLLRR
jgi:hypothetical protein